MGKRRTQVELANQGTKIGIYRAASLMKKANVIAIRPKKRQSYPSGDIHNKADHLLKRQFNPATIHSHWVGKLLTLSVLVSTRSDSYPVIQEIHPILYIRINLNTDIGRFWSLTPHFQ